MKFTTFSRLSLATAALALCLATEAQAVVGCGASKAASGLTTSLGAAGEGGPGSSLTPDTQALAKAVGSFGAAATLIAGGMLLYRRQRSADGLAAVEPEVGLDFTVQPEAVLVDEALLAEVSPADEAEAVLSR